MCLLAIGWHSSDSLPFVFAGNRDEYHARPCVAAHWWQDAPHVLAGRDLVAGGSWLGISRTGRFAVVTNRPDLPAPKESPLSRGALVANWLTAADPHSDETLRSVLEVQSPRYGGFSLLTATLANGNKNQLHCFSGGNQSGPLKYEQLPEGITGLSNSALDRPWPKLTWLNRELARLLHSGHTDPEQLFALLRREEPVPGSGTTGISARPFISGQEYGTRCSTIITLDNRGCCHFVERRFGPGGLAGGEIAFDFRLENFS